MVALIVVALLAASAVFLAADHSGLHAFVDLVEDE